ncbi:acetyltransferase [Aureobasidium sp. EXF-12298]|nr:acetyltransferase [Aureobasidium sp. EXF-12298]
MATSQSELFNIRKATPKDAQAVAELGTHVFTVTFGPSMQPTNLQAYLSETYSISATATEIQNPNKDMLLATSTSDTILGFALLTRGLPDPCIADISKQVQLQRIYLHPEAQGRGVGKLLIQRIEGEARKQGFSNLWLAVYEKNDKAFRIYEKLGFRKVGTHDFVTGSEVQTDLVMLKAL